MLFGSVQSGNNNGNNNGSATIRSNSIVSSNVSGLFVNRVESQFMKRNAHFDRFLMLLIVLRVLDISYMSSGYGPCTVLLGTFMWLIFLQIEVYNLFLSDTLYWKSYMSDLVKRSQKEQYSQRRNGGIVGSSTNGNGGNGGSVAMGVVSSTHNGGGGGAGVGGGGEQM